ncbi:MAG: hypothetical protein AABW63_00020 [Nanoarchaeota archaeon]
MLKFNFQNTVLFGALLAAPIAGLMLHNRIHPTITYLPYILLFDIVIISGLYLFEKTRFSGFVLNSVFFLVGIIMHLTYVPGGGISDILLSIPDFTVGYTLWKLNIHFETPAPVREVEKTKKKK